MRRGSRVNAPAREEPGHLVIIGGAEDRQGAKTILSRFVELAGGRDAKIVVLTAASAEPKEMWKIYDDAFGDLGVKQRMHLPFASRTQAGERKNAEQILSADGVFMTGGT